MTAYLYPHPHSAESLDRIVTLTGKRMALGRSASNEVVLAMQNVSRHHAYIQQNPQTETWELYDNDSSNGTFVNGERLAGMYQLCEGDAISFATVECIFSLLSPEQQHTIPAFRSLSDNMGVLHLLNDEGDETRGDVLSVKPVSMDARPISRDDFDPRLAYELAQRRLNIMYELAPILSKSSTIEQMAARVLDLLFHVSGIDRASLLTCEHPGDFPNLMLVRLRDPEKMNAEVMVSNRIVSRCLAERVAILGRSQIIPNGAADGETIPASLICVPLIAHVEMIGVLCLETLGEDHSSTEDDLSFFSLFGTDLALSLVNFRLSQQNLRNARMAAMGTAIAGLAHNVKNILQLINAGITLMDAAVHKRKSAGDSDDVTMCWPVVRRGVGRMKDMCAELLSFSRQTPPELRQISVNKIISELVEAADSAMQSRNVELRTELQEVLPPHAIEPESLTRALANLLTNAMDSMNESGGQITIRTLSNNDDNSVKIIVADTGVGIPRDKISRIWEPFFSTKGSRGTGLGLAMTRKVVEDMNGTISLNSEEGVGTTFEIVFPCLRDDQLKEIVHEVEQTQTPFTGLTNEAENYWHDIGGNDSACDSSAIVLPPDLRE
ncbi:FHA domain-containing protein [Candidatus Sumerlaeota bacterium]|nr:FHA domain-containing protein [Candidatus Sumerlaeota bacterium]